MRLRIITVAAANSKRMNSVLDAFFSYEYRIDNVLLAYGSELAYDDRLLRKTSFKSNAEDFTISKFDF